MKIVIGSIAIFLLLLLSTGFIEPEGNDEPTRILGSWEFSAPKAANKYQKGTLFFTVDGGILTGAVSVEGQLIPMRKLIYENDKVRAYIMVGGTQVDLYLKFQKDSFEGTVSNPRGYLRVAGIKKE